MTDQEKHDSARLVEGEKLNFHYIKSRHFRVIHADGAFGGVTAKGYIHFAFYNERGAIPRITEVNIKADGTTSKEKTVEGREGVVRELEVDVLMDEKAAEELVVWLQQKIKLISKLRAEGIL